MSVEYKIDAGFETIMVVIDPDLDAIRRFYESDLKGSIYRAFQEFAEGVYAYAEWSLRDRMANGPHGSHTYTGRLEEGFEPQWGIYRRRGTGGKFASGAPDLPQGLFFAMHFSETKYTVPFDQGSSPAHEAQDGLTYRRILNWAIRKGIRPRYSEYYGEWREKTLRTKDAEGVITKSRIRYRRVRPASIERAAFLIYRKIMREGTDPSHVITGMLYDVEDYVQDEGMNLANDIVREINAGKPRPHGGYRY